ncbi:hypothetical protein SUNI508_05687 [Seiridium unicorne]|uniref:Uncharacterized protein n=1 Tax=Seiridium unicorne TaxID=138068 RepID=A0ABR2V3J4_9PEZI
MGHFAASRPLTAPNKAHGGRSIHCITPGSVGNGRGYGPSSDICPALQPVAAHGAITAAPVLINRPQSGALGPFAILERTLLLANQLKHMPDPQHRDSVMVFDDKDTVNGCRIKFCRPYLVRHARKNAGEGLRAQRLSVNGNCPLGSRTASEDPARLGALIFRSIGIQAPEQTLRMVWNAKRLVGPHQGGDSQQAVARLRRESRKPWLRSSRADERRRPVYGYLRAAIQSFPFSHLGSSEWSPIFAK